MQKHARSCIIMLQFDQVKYNSVIKCYYFNNIAQKKKAAMQLSDSYVLFAE